MPLTLLSPIILTLAFAYAASSPPDRPQGVALPWGSVAGAHPGTLAPQGSWAGRPATGEVPVGEPVFDRYPAVGVGGLRMAPEGSASSPELCRLPGSRDRPIEERTSCRPTIGVRCDSRWCIPRRHDVCPGQSVVVGVVGADVTGDGPTGPLGDPARPAELGRPPRDPQDPFVISAERADVADHRPAHPRVMRRWPSHSRCQVCRRRQKGPRCLKAGSSGLMVPWHHPHSVGRSMTMS